MSSPDDIVASVLAALDGLEEVDVHQHPARFEAVHEGLRRLLDGDEAAAS
ncbi:hypothetical protein [uncultured Aeromicrobium sp.]|nr:hypothetical protein [uncultured Aeromicrobium sp.]